MALQILEAWSRTYQNGYEGDPTTSPPFGVHFKRERIDGFLDVWVLDGFEPGGVVEVHAGVNC